jgi:hypothetical protein
MASATRPYQGRSTEALMAALRGAMIAGPEALEMADLPGADRLRAAQVLLGGEGDQAGVKLAGALAMGMPSASTGATAEDVANALRLLQPFYGQGVPPTVRRNLAEASRNKLGLLREAGHWWSPARAGDLGPGDRPQGRGRHGHLRGEGRPCHDPHGDARLRAPQRDSALLRALAGAGLLAGELQCGRPFSGRMTVTSSPTPQQRSHASMGPAVFRPDDECPALNWSLTELMLQWGRPFSGRMTSLGGRRAGLRFVPSEWHTRSYAHVLQLLASTIPERASEFVPGGAHPSQRAMTDAWTVVAAALGSSGLTVVGTLWLERFRNHHDGQIARGSTSGGMQSLART